MIATEANPLLEMDACAQERKANGLTGREHTQRHLSWRCGKKMECVRGKSASAVPQILDGVTTGREDNDAPTSRHQDSWDEGDQCQCILNILCQLTAQFKILARVSHRLLAVRSSTNPKQLDQCNTMTTDLLIPSQSNSPFPQIRNHMFIATSTRGVSCGPLT